MQGLRVIWFALVISVLMYGIITQVAVPVGDGSIVERTTSNPILLVLLLAALSAAVFPVVFFSTLARRAPTTRGAYIVCWAVIESAGVFGVVVSIFGNDARLFIPGGVAALVSMLITFPREREPQLTT